MSPRAERVRTLTALLDEASDALARADFSAFAEAAAALDAAAPRTGTADPEAHLALKRSLDRLGALLGHVAGVHQALQGIHPEQTAFYDRRGAGAPRANGRLRREA